MSECETHTSIWTNPLTYVLFPTTGMFFIIPMGKICPATWQRGGGGVNIKMSSAQYRDFLIQIRWLHERLILMMEIHSCKDSYYIETGCGPLLWSFRTNIIIVHGYKRLWWLFKIINWPWFIFLESWVIAANMIDNIVYSLAWISNFIHSFTWEIIRQSCPKLMP